ncbi:DUF2062 domain-containing protein [Thermodesulfobacteriota bacterium]
MKLNRLTRYYYLRFIRLRGEPHELALGMAFGIFSGMMPIIPFHMAFSVLLALVFKGSKITAALGTWVSNPLDWVLFYYLNYKIGAIMLGLHEDNGTVSSVLEPLQRGEEGMAVITKIMSAGGEIISALIIGGLIMGVVAAIPSYFIFLNIFSLIKIWRKEKREQKRWRKLNQ